MLDFRKLGQYSVHVCCVLTHSCSILISVYQDWHTYCRTQSAFIMPLYNTTLDFLSLLGTKWSVLSYDALCIMTGD